MPEPFASALHASTPAHPAPGPRSPRAEFDSQELMRGGREVLIRHAGQVYRLQHTRNDKLILVK